MATQTPLEVRPGASANEIRATLHLGRDVVAWINDRHDKDGKTYDAIAAELAEHTGVRVTSRTLHNWRMQRASESAA